MRRIVRFIRFHPIRFASATLLSAAVLVLALMSIHPSKDTNPSYVRAKDEFLVVYNTHGEELWRKHIGERFDASAYEVSTSASVGPEKYHVVFDVDGDGTNEVLSIFGWTGLQTPLDNMIFCYNADGSERWKYTLHRQMTFGSVTYNDSYRFYTLAVGNYGGNGTSEVVAVAGHFPWVPSDIIRLNGNDGKYSSEFWHPGRLEAFAHKHIEGRHEDELLFAGKNGLYGQAAILVMDPRQISGAAPMPDSSRPAGIAPGTEKYYVLIPGSDLQKFWNDPSAVDAIDFANDGTLEVIVNEKTSGHQTAQLHFIFDSTLSCIRVSGSNTFTWIHDEYAKEGKIATVLNDRYFDELRKNVRYWDGDKFVTDRTINRHYIEAIGKISIP